MADANYILGTNEYVVVEVERTALSADYTATNWTYELCLVPLGGESTAWASAVYELATDDLSATHHTVKALLPELTTVIGRYLPRVRMTAVGDETETPTLIEVSDGMVIVKA